MYCVFVVPLIPDPSIAFTLTSNHDDLYLSHNCPLQYKSKRLSAYYAKYFTGYSQQKTGKRLTSACNSMAYELGCSQCHMNLGAPRKMRKRGKPGCVAAGVVAGLTAGYLFIIFLIKVIILILFIIIIVVISFVLCNF